MVGGEVILPGMAIVMGPMMSIMMVIICVR
jgi:hypothetical protein